MQSIKNFLSLFSSNIIQKLFGLVREPIIAFFFGTSLIYSSYLLIKTAADFLSQLTMGESIKASMLPKFTKIYNQYRIVSLKEVGSFSKRVMLYLFIISQIIQAILILYLDTEYTIILFCLSVLLSIILCYNFFNTIFLTIMQSQGRFYRYSLISLLNPFIGIVFIYPLTFLWSIIGLALSRLIGIISLTFAYIIPMQKSNDGYMISLTKKDFNIPVLFLGNFANITIIFTRFISGIDGSNNIAYFTYSVFILNTLLTAVINNLNTLLLKRLSIEKNIRFILYTFSIVLTLGVLLIIFINFYAEDLISILFQRGAFKESDTLITADYLRYITIPFILISISSILFQPFFASESKYYIKDAKYIMYVFLAICILTCIIISVSNFTAQYNSLIMLYTLSIVSLFLAVFACIRSFKYE